MEDWKFYKDIDFNDESITQYNVDTRDFHVGCGYNDRTINTRTADATPELFYHTGREVLDLLTRLHEVTGGGHLGTWRMLTFNCKEDVSGWDFKYIRIYRTEKGLLVGTGRDNDVRYFSKGFLFIKKRMMLWSNL
jgi:hypothetical protein